MIKVEDMGTTKRGNLSQRRKLAIWEREHGKCMVCGVKLMTGGFIYEHVRALELGGTDTDDNIRLTCKPCATSKTKIDHQTAGKAKRKKASYLGLKESRTPLPLGKNSKWKKKLNGQVVLRNSGE
jgi:5-methylcytosine-specific restriction endonuclease McrA